GPVSVGAEGAVVRGSDGALVMVAPGSVNGSATVAISPVSQASLPMPVPAGFMFMGGFRLDSSQTLNHPVQLIVPAPAGAQVGDLVYFYRAGSLPDESDNPRPL